LRFGLSDVADAVEAGVGVFDSRGSGFMGNVSFGSSLAI
jgi:hypothetical protein